MRWIYCILLLFALAGLARAQVIEIYKCVDANGRPHYTNDKRELAGKKCELVSSLPASPAPSAAPPGQKPAASAKTATPPGFPREEAASRASAKEKEREILARELVQEEGLLAKAKKELTDQENIRSGDEKNFARVLERLQPYKNTLEVHTKNVEALKQELGKLLR